MSRTAQPQSTNFISPEVANNAKPEKKGLTKKQLMGLSAAALALASAIGGGVAVNAINQGRSVNAIESPANTNNESVPTEAKSFVNEYGTRYEDPVSTYYAEKAYEANGAKSVILSDKFVSNYEMTNRPDDSSIGFAECRMATETELTESVSMDIFNQYASKELSLYMNALAKNPTPEAVAVIDNQFMNSCSNTINPNVPGSAFTDDDQDIATLMNTAKTIVAKYGSAANYNVMPASTDFYDTGTSCFFGGTHSTQKDGGGKIKSAQDVLNLLISIDVFKNNKESHITETIKNFEFSVYRQPNTANTPFTYISIGQFKVQ